MSETIDRVVRPCVIVGALRAGTTLLRLLCDHHPEVSIFGEFEESVAMLPESGELSVAEYLEKLKVHRAFGSSGATLPTSAESYREAVLAVLRQRVASTDAATIGFCVHSRPERLPDLWPHARYVHLLRDPRDVARSCIGMGWVGTVYHGTHYWLDVERRIERLRERVPAEQFMSLRYEDLVREPEAELTRVCGFLGHAYDPAMTAIDQDTTYTRPDAKLAEQWRRKLTPREIELVEWRCGSMMAERGYEPVNAKPRGPSASEKASLNMTNRSGKFAFRCRRYGLPLTLGWAAARRLPESHGLRRRLRSAINRIDTEHLK